MANPSAKGPTSSRPEDESPAAEATTETATKKTAATRTAQKTPTKKTSTRSAIKSAKSSAAGADSRTVVQLRAEAKKQGVSGYYRMSKAQLIAALG